VQQAQKWQIGLGNGFEEPILFQKVLVLRMPDEWEMSVKD
jgi:hypothetical protein